MKLKILAGLFALSSMTAFAQLPAQEETVVLTAKQGVVTRGAKDPNITQGMKPNDANNPAKFVKKNTSQNDSTTVELKSSKATVNAIDKNIKSDESLNVKNKPKKKIN